MTEPTNTLTRAFEALKYNPLMVGILLLNMLFVSAAVWYLMSLESQRTEYIKIILDRCLTKGN